MQLITTSLPDNKLIEELHRLCTANKYPMDYFQDHLNTDTFYGYIKDNQLICCVIINIYDDRHLELNGLTDAHYRHQGLFSSLLRIALLKLQSCNYSIVSFNKPDYEFINTNILSSEFLMELNSKNFLPPISIKSHLDIEEYVYEDDYTSQYVYVGYDNNTVVGLLRIDTGLAAHTLHHFMIRKHLRNLGYGKGLLVGALKMFFENYNDSKIILHVTKDNTAALCLYQGFGFDTKVQFDLYSIRLKDYCID